jgi:hypothetical protein
MSRYNPVIVSSRRTQRILDSSIGSRQCPVIQTGFRNPVRPTGLGGRWQLTAGRHGDNSHLVPVPLMYTPFTAIFLLFSHVSLPACSTCLACCTVHTVMYYRGSLRLLLHVHLPPSPSRTPRHGYMTTPTTNVHYLGAKYWHYSTGRGIIHCEGYF